MVGNIVRTLIDSVFTFQRSSITQSLELDNRKITSDMLYADALKILWNNYFYLALQYIELKDDQAESRRVIGKVLENGSSKFIKVIQTTKDVSDNKSIYRVLQYHNRYIQNALIGSEIDTIEEALYWVPNKLYDKVESMDFAEELYEVPYIYNYPQNENVEGPLKKEVLLRREDFCYAV